MVTQQHSSKERPPFRRDTYGWGTLLYGNIDAMVAADVAQQCWFADLSDRTKRGQIVRQKRLVVDGRRVLTVRNHRNRGRAYIYFTDAEIEAQKQEHDALEEQPAPKKKPVPREEQAGRLLDFWDYGLQLIDASCADSGWKIAESERQKLLELSAQGHALLAKVHLLPANAPALRLVKA